MSVRASGTSTRPGMLGNIPVSSISAAFHVLRCQNEGIRTLSRVKTSVGSTLDKSDPLASGLRLLYIGVLVKPLSPLRRITPVLDSSDFPSP